MTSDDPIGAWEERRKTGRAIFGDDWIGDLSARDEKLIADYGPTIGETEDPAGVDAFSIGSNTRPCPKTLRDDLDRALGRFFRMRAQQIAAINWLKRNWLDRSRSGLEEAFATLEPAPVSKPGRGRQPTETDRVERAVRAQIRSGDLTPEKFLGTVNKVVCGQFKCGTKVVASVKERIEKRPI